MADSDIVRGSAHPESDSSLIDSLNDDKDNRSIVFDGAVHVCVCVCACVSFLTMHRMDFRDIPVSPAISPPPSFCVLVVIHDCKRVEIARERMFLAAA